MKCLQEFEELADDIASCPLADVQNLLNDASSLRSRNFLLMKQMRRYEKQYNGMQIDDSSSTLQPSSRTVPVSRSIPVRTSTTTYNNAYDVSTSAISFDITTTTVPSNPFAFCQPIRYDYTTQGIYTTTENSRLMQQFQWPSHRRQCDDIYDRPASYEIPEFCGKDKYLLNLPLKQSQTSANGLNMHSTG